MRDAKAIATALLRTSMGLMFLTHVYLRLTVITWPVAVAFFQSLGLPPATAYAVTITEATVGILLVVGWQVRAAALAGAVILAGAAVLVHVQNGFLFSNAGGGWEYPAFWGVALLCQSMLGAGWTHPVLHSSASLAASRSRSQVRLRYVRLRTLSEPESEDRPVTMPEQDQRPVAAK